MPIIRCDLMRQYSKYQVKVFQLDSKEAHTDQTVLVKNPHRLEQWTKLIQEYLSSGMKIDDWCDANGVTRHAYLLLASKNQTDCLLGSSDG